MESPVDITLANSHDRAPREDLLVRTNDSNGSGTSGALATLTDNATTFFFCCPTPDSVSFAAGKCVLETLQPDRAIATNGFCFVAFVLSDWIKNFGINSLTTCLGVPSWRFHSGASRSLWWWRWFPRPVETERPSVEGGPKSMDRRTRRCPVTSPVLNELIAEKARKRFQR